jgi:hypothetical protein
MKHIKTFEGFLNENLNEAMYSITAAPQDPSTIAIYNNGKIELDYKFMYLDKKGWSFVSSGSHGEESRSVAKCPVNKYEEISLNVINSLKGKTWSNFDAMKKEVSAELKKNC